MQLFLTIAVIAAAGSYLAYYVVKHHIAVKEDCDGCAVKKMMENKS